MSNENWHAGGMTAAVIAAAGLAALPAISFVGMYGLVGVPMCGITFLVIFLCWWYIGSKTRQVRPETQAETNARTSKQFAAGLTVATFVLVVALMSGMMFR